MRKPRQWIEGLSKNIRDLVVFVLVADSEVGESCVESRCLTAMDESGSVDDRRVVVDVFELDEHAG